MMIWAMCKWRNKIPLLLLIGNNNTRDKERHALELVMVYIRDVFRYAKFITASRWIQILEIVSSKIIDLFTPQGLGATSQNNQDVKTGLVILLTSKKGVSKCFGKFDSFNRVPRWWRERCPNKVIGRIMIVITSKLARYEASSKSAFCSHPARFTLLNLQSREKTGGKKKREMR